MELRKFEAYEGNLTTYSNRVEYHLANLEKEANAALLDDIRLLAEACYKEGYMDGYRFADWLHETTE